MASNVLHPLHTTCIYSDAQREKFNQLYKMEAKEDLEETVIRLVEMVQTCLFIFGLFSLSDIDGLLCNATERGLDEFYETFLSSKFQVTLQSLWTLTRSVYRCGISMITWLMKLETSSSMHL